MFDGQSLMGLCQIISSHMQRYLIFMNGSAELCKMN